MHFRTLIIAGQAAEIVRQGREGVEGGKAALEITIKDALKGSQWASSKQQTEGGSKGEGRAGRMGQIRGESGQQRRRMEQRCQAGCRLGCFWSANLS